ncbi:MAG TPA: hypothetical protein PKY29_04545 [Ferruginibacter sp.]|nr:hypothetical protein [Ferruginibacter sp.]HRQ20558.1 hypothetical protein [Ferruginibacter sp.]
MKPLILKSETHKLVEPNDHKSFHTFIPKVGEVTALLRNFTRERKYFKFAIQEVDADGNPLTEPVVNTSIVGSHIEMAPVDQSFLEPDEKERVNKKSARKRKSAKTDLPPSRMDECLPPPHE